MPKTPIRKKSVSQLAREKKIHRVFQLIAPRYDQMNDFLSFRMHRSLKKKLIQQISIKPSDIIVDLASGTGDIAKALIKTKATILAVDSSIEMLLENQESKNITKIVAVGEKIPLTDSSIDTLTLSFGLCTMGNMSSALQEIHRVLKPGGHFYCLEFSQANWPFRTFFRLYNQLIMPTYSRWITGHEEAGQYLIETIQRAPNQKEMKKLIENCGFINVTYKNLLFGMACIHRGINKNSPS